MSLQVSPTTVASLNELLKQVYSMPMIDLGISEGDFAVIANEGGEITVEAFNMKQPPSPFGSRVTDNAPDTSDDTWRLLMRQRGLPPVDRATFLAAHGMLIPDALVMDGLKLLERIYGDGDEDLPF